MSDPVRCPNCDRVMADDGLAPDAPCPACGAAFAPPGAHRGRRQLVAAGLAALLVCGVIGGLVAVLPDRPPPRQREEVKGKPGEEPLAKAAPATTPQPRRVHAVPGGTVTVAFPGEVTETLDRDVLALPPLWQGKTPALRSDDADTGLSFAARALTFAESTYHFHNDAELAAQLAEPAARAVQGGKPGPTTPATSNGYRSVQVVVPTDSGRVHVIRGVACGMTSVSLSVSGPGLDPADERVRRFFDSVTPPESRAPRWKPVALRAGEEFRPLAWILPAYGAGFAPSRDAVYVRELSPAAYWKADWRTDPRHPVSDLFKLSEISHYDDGPLVRYHYPSFRREGEVKVEKSRGCVVNDAANQLYVLGEQGLLVYDLGPPRAPPPEPRLLKQVPVLPLTSTPPVVAANGRYAFWLAWGVSGHGKATAVRLDTKTLELKELPLDNHYRLIGVSPGGKSVVAASVFEVGAWNKDSVGSEIDPEAWRVRKTFKLASSPHSLVATDDRRVMYVSFAGGSDSSGRVAALDLNDPTPKEKYIDRPPTRAGLYLSPDGRRLYASGRARSGHWGFARGVVAFPIKDNSAFVWDAGEAAHGRTRELGELRSSREQRLIIGDEAYLSPDGKCLLFHSGRAYWLAGAGPVPKVDPVARWGR
jgi:hypothetical protein